SGELLGSISAVISTGGHDLYVLEQAGQDKKSLIPAVKKFIKQVDLAANRVIVELPEGLLDL
ncbi:MAG TPA: PRC-barrel domain-containing protein, partial [Candidatus Limnocylindrales bacterium]|nr:PRC-barrel domain-containing protein [Candidatus Limnocylindrales bacterium]